MMKEVLRIEFIRILELRKKLLLARCYFLAEYNMQHQVVVPLPWQIHATPHVIFERALQVLLYLILQHVEKSFFATLQFLYVNQKLNFFHDSSGVSYTLYICCILSGSEHTGPAGIKTVWCCCSFVEIFVLLSAGIEERFRRMYHGHFCAIWDHYMHS